MTAHPMEFLNYGVSNMYEIEVRVKYVGNHKNEDRLVNKELHYKDVAKSKEDIDIDLIKAILDYGLSFNIM